MQCDPDLIPALWPVAGEPGAGACTAGWSGVVLAALLVAWRTFPAITGRSWLWHPNPSHLTQVGQRIGDTIVPLGLLLATIGMVERDWGWQAIGFGTVLAWVLGTMALGIWRERTQPEAPATTASLLDVAASDPPEGQRATDVPPEEQH